MSILDFFASKKQKYLLETYLRMPKQCVATNWIVWKAPLITCTTDDFYWFFYGASDF